MAAWPGEAEVREAYPSPGPRQPSYSPNKNKEIDRDIINKIKIPLMI
jgi:hypothetical protein